MKVQVINFINNISPKQINSKPTFKSTPAGDSFSYSKDSASKSYQKFLKDCKTKFPDKTIPEILSTVSMYDDFIGEGKQSRVYKIKGLDEYAVKLSKCEYDYDPEWYKDPIKPCKDDFPNYNFGQAIATVGFSAKILKKVTGETNGIENWFTKYEHSTPRTREDAEKILNDVVRIAQFPQKSFDKVANEIKFLTSNKIKIDTINPNNFVIDYDKKQISLVDIEKKEYTFSNNTAYDLIVPLLDLTSFNEYLELFNEKEAEQFLKSAKTICKKVLKTGLPDDLEADKKYRKRELLTAKGINEFNNLVWFLKN